ncbi:MAG: DNA-directed RNA polymerase subunit omega [Rhodobacterales bacterium]|nr:DNA-directed RNA polymerase subunit omega [Rhodobacterales bacterium]
MARVTVEDCVVRVPNRFELVMLAAQRARQMSAGAALTVERDNDKNPVVALREIADETVELEELEGALVKGLQRFVELDEPEEDEMDLIAIQQEISGEVGEARPDAEIVADVLSVQDDMDIDDAGMVMDFSDVAEGSENA